LRNKCFVQCFWGNVNLNVMIVSGYNVKGDTEAFMVRLDGWMVEQ
jgi:hypothetical protein